MKWQAYVISIMMVVLVLSACTQQSVSRPKTPAGTQDPQNSADLFETGFESGSGIKKFDTTKDIIEYLGKSTNSQIYYGNSRNDMMLMDMEESFAMADGAISKASAQPSAAGSSQSASDFSATNVQVEGVDEADIVKNDGKYIYMVNQEKLLIINAFPAREAEIVFEDDLPGRPKDLYVNGDRLAVFIEDDDETFSIQPYDFMPRPRYVQNTRVIIYDIEDRSSPEAVKDYTLTGNYLQSRMIGDYVYFVVMDNVYYYDNFIDLPIVREAGQVIARPEIYYFDNPEDNYVFHTVSSFNINDDDEKIESKSYLMGYSNTMYVSEENIYIAYQKNVPWRYQELQKSERFYEAVVPLLPEYERKKILEIKKMDIEDYEKSMRISEVMQEMYDEMEEDDAQDLIEEIYEAIEEYDIKKEIDRRKTVIHKININDGDIDYDASGEVSGYLLNQFSLDEHSKNLRVATTTDFWTSRGSVQYNNVYVLDDEMKVIGSLEKLAEDERIYSTRFIGERLYMVTFKRIDPLFVIDLSNPKKPSVLGELKIPGYSDYLHPYDEDHIIGIGKETGGNEWGGLSVKGVKLSLFDVSDVKNPKQIDKYEIGSSGTDSEALRDHKAFLFDKEKNILVIPVREVKENRLYDKSIGYYQDRVWQGAYVFGLTPKDGFELKAKITHQEGLEQYYDYYNGNAVRRALYMDDILYTISGKKIMMNDLDDELEEVNEVKLPYDSGQRWWWY